MVGRQKVEAALSKSGTTEIPIVLCYEDIYIRDHWEQLCKQPWWLRFSPSIDEQMQWRQQVFPAIGQDWFYLSGCPSKQTRKYTRLETRLDGVYHIDDRSGAAKRLEEPHPGGEFIGFVGESLKVTEDIESLLPLVEDYDPDQILQQGKGDLAEILLTSFGESLYPIRHVGAPLWSCYYLWGFEGLMCRVAEQPDVVSTACERFLALAVQQVKLAARMGAAGVWIEDCLTDMVSPKDFARLNLPFLQRLVEAIRQEGMHSFYYYCGNPHSRWDLLMDVGADALSLEEGKKGFQIDIAEVVKHIKGRCAVVGNLDAIHLLPCDSLNAVKSEVRRQVAAGCDNHGRFLMGVGSPITPGTPAERVRWLCDLVHEI